ncbi:TetR/AcrR family transcriptional regulator [Sphingomonas montanisoli]|uniref:TetR/AcrR family transcriptional regulator n=1 Tax=Sphingomonas montanisoli TaxID=2606412 RepID=A0A5D9C9F0_9SPHN|nr:TetR/AcrR family transcriptional regulator [Sphingomonas montanisoli]TZG27897.1 TetR/AcrR family transcriptional regulator [Sphingomonas montanisoli]
MTKTKRRSATGPGLIEAGERLFARHGIHGVALRQIATEAGSANSSAVHYHFGDAHGFVRAIFAHRLPALEAARVDLMRGAEARGEPDVGTLLDILFRPFVVGADVSGYASYAAFLLEVRKAGWLADWQEMAGPVTKAIPQRILSQMEARGVADAQWRLEAITMMIIAAIAAGQADRYDGLVAIGTAALLA